MNWRSASNNPFDKFLTTFGGREKEGAEPQAFSVRGMLPIFRAAALRAALAESILRLSEA
jgi:hypothetical protein